MGDKSKVAVGNRTSTAGDAGDTRTRVQTKDVEAGNDSTIEIGNQRKQ